MVRTLRCGLHMLIEKVIFVSVFSYLKAIFSVACQPKDGRKRERGDEDTSQVKMSDGMLNIFIIS